MEIKCPKKIVYVICVIGLAVFLYYMNSDSPQYGYYSNSVPANAINTIEVSASACINETCMKMDTHTTFVYSEEHLLGAVNKIHNQPRERRNNLGMCTQQLPNVLVLGVWKCGTREIADFFSMHPSIVVKRNPYEVNYFHQRRMKRLDHDYVDYRRKMPCRHEDQLTLVKNPWYFTSGKFAERIHRFNSSLKMIVLIREPIARLISSVTFKYQGRNLDKRYKNVTDYFMKQVFTANGNIRETNVHVRYSRYIDGYRQYAKYFDMKQILFIDAVDFKQKPFTVLQEVERFLGLKHFISASHFVYNPQKDFYCVRDPSSNDGNTKGVCFGERRGRTNSSAKIDVNPETYQKLREYYQPYNEELFGLIGRKLDW